MEKQLDDQAALAALRLARRCHEDADEAVVSPGARGGYDLRLLRLCSRVGTAVQGRVSALRWPPRQSPSRVWHTAELVVAAASLHCQDWLDYDERRADDAPESGFPSRCLPPGLVIAAAVPSMVADAVAVDE